MTKKEEEKLDETQVEKVLSDYEKEKKSEDTKDAEVEEKDSSQDQKSETTPTSETNSIVDAEALTKQVSAGANYFGSMLSSAWSKGTSSLVTSPTEEDNPTSKSKGGFLGASTSFFSKVTGSAKPEEDSDKPKAEETSDKAEAEEEKGQENSSSYFPKSASSFFSSTTTNLSSMGSSWFASAEKSEEKQDQEKSTENSSTSKNLLDNLSSFDTASALSAVTSVTKQLKDKVNNASMIAEFNKEQAEFVKSKSKDKDYNVAPWVGYNEEEELKDKILSLSEDKRNFLRAPPSGVAFEFDYSTASATALAILKEDPRLDKMRYDLVPKKVKEEEFWRNYFYRVSLIKQSFDLKDLETSSVGSAKETQPRKLSRADHPAVSDGDLDLNDTGDDEFVSESFQASTKDIAEAERSVKNLAVSKDDTEWEAELEGELNEFEVLSGAASSKSGGGKSGETCGEAGEDWEDEIQEMLDAEMDNEDEAKK